MAFTPTLAFENGRIKAATENYLTRKIKTTP